MYDTCKNIYDSALRSRMLDEKNAENKVLEEVVPKLIAYKAIMVIRDIQLRKAAEAKHAKLKAERKAKQGIVAPEKEEEKDPTQMTEEEARIAIMKNKEKQEEELMTEEQLEQKREEEEREKYGRYWVWEGYFNEKRKDQWLETAELLKHINPHVLQDIEDYILLEGFKGMKTDKIRQEIEDDQKARLADEKKLKAPDERDDFEEFKNKESSKRRFLLPLRPTDNLRIWNFFEDCDEDLKTKHVLRFNANPEKAYEDGRIQKIMENLDEIAMNLKSHNEQVWTQLRKNTMAVFQQEYKEFRKALE